MPPRRQASQGSQQPRTTSVRDIDHFDALKGGPQLCVAVYTDVRLELCCATSQAVSEGERGRDCKVPASRLIVVQSHTSI